MRPNGIPKKYYNLMQKGICPACKKPMIKDGKQTHNKTMALVCEEKFREKINRPTPTIKIEGKLYEVSAKYVDRNAKE